MSQSLKNSLKQLLQRFDMFPSVCVGCSEGGLDAFSFLFLNTTVLYRRGAGLAAWTRLEGTWRNQHLTSRASFQNRPARQSLLLQRAAWHRRREVLLQEPGWCQKSSFHSSLCHYCCTWLDLATVFLRFQIPTVNKSVRKRMPPKCDLSTFTPP